MRVEIGQTCAMVMMNNEFSFVCLTSVLGNDVSQSLAWIKLKVCNLERLPKSVIYIVMSVSNILIVNKYTYSRQSRNF